MTQLIVGRAVQLSDVSSSPTARAPMRLSTTHAHPVEQQPARKHTPMRFSDLANLTAPVTVDYHGHAINLTYYTEKLYEQAVREQLEALQAAPVEEAAPAVAPVEAEAAPQAPADETPAQAAARLTREAAERKARAQAAVVEECESLKSVIASWDFLGDNDQPFPLTIENLIACGPILRKLFTQAILNDLFRPLRAAR
jgi:hypothetical protein